MSNNFWVLCISILSTANTPNIRILHASYTPEKDERLIILGFFEDDTLPKKILEHFGEAGILRRWQERKPITLRVP